MLMQAGIGAITSSMPAAMRPLLNPGEATINSRFLALIFAILLLVVGFLAAGLLTGSIDLRFIEPSEEQKRAAAIFQLNQGTPKDLGNGTQLDGVMAVGEGVQYQFTLTQLSSDEVDSADFHQFIYETSRTQICSHRELRVFLITTVGFVEAKYSGRDGAEITVVRFSKSDCE